MGKPLDENLPEVVPDASPQALSYAEANQRGFLEESNAKYTVVHDAAPKYSNTSAGGHEKDERRTCGMKRRTFFVVLAALLLLITGAAVGGGVGGAKAAEAKSLEGKDEPQGVTSGPSTKTSVVSSPSSSTPSPTTSKPSSSSITKTTPSPSATPSQIFLNNQTFTQQGYAVQAFAQDNYLGAVSEVYRTAGFIDPPFVVSSYVWLRGGTGCCVTFCADPTRDVGFSCDTKYQPNASSEFTRFYVWCTGDLKEESVRCS